MFIFSINGKEFEIETHTPIFAIAEMCFNVTEALNQVCQLDGSTLIKSIQIVGRGKEQYKFADYLFAYTTIVFDDDEVGFHPNIAVNAKRLTAALRYIEAQWKEIKG